MSSASSGSQNNGGQQKHAEEISSSSPRAAESGLLERVIRQTLELCQPGGSIDAADMRALRDVAERYRGRPLEFEPVAVELVAAAIDGLCPAKKNTDFWRNLCAQVARILMEDPSTFARMNSFWLRLSGGPP
jgi:hypothetical protein